MSKREYPVLNNTPVAKKVQSIYESRLRLFTAHGEYEKLNLPHFYERAVIESKSNVKISVHSVPDLARPLFKDVIPTAKWREVSKGEAFGPSWSTHWFKIEVKIPSDGEWAKAEQIIFKWNCENEGLVFTDDGKASVGLSGEERQDWIVPSSWNNGKWHTFYIETSCNGMFGNADPNNNIQPPDPNRWFTLRTAELQVPNLEARALYIDFWVIGDAAREFPNDSWQKHKAREVANRIIDAFDSNDPDASIKKGRAIAKEYLGDNIDSSKVYDSKTREEVLGIGHCHIDTAWLWPYAETRRKIGRSWTSQLDLIERYPEYRFVCSQAQQYKWLLEDYPDVFERLKAAAKKDNFIPIGGSWVENDTNMPTGEAIARQFLSGQRFFEAHFGKRCRTFWLPDTFGYSAQMPQLCRLAGMDRFLTQKLSWNNINNFPNTTFNWVALDGTQVLCHMPPDNTYTAAAHFGDVSRSLHQHKNLDTDQTGLLVFGHGDGGGGPTSEMLEKLRRCRGLSDTVGLLPRVHLGNDVDDFYTKIQENTHYGRDLVTWVGELYFEFHRGTYTTQSDIKKGNRLSEILLHDLEFIATLASVKNSKYVYPKKDIDDLWEDVCLNQFHDVLPGSSIEMVYDDAKEIYKHVFFEGDRLVREALDALGISTHSSENCQVIGLNTMPWGRGEIVEIPKDNNISEDDITIQVEENKQYVYLHSEESGIARPVALSPSSTLPKVTVKEVSKGVFVLENDNLKATIEGGLLTSLVDLVNDREVLAPGAKGNQFVIFEDEPLNWQAWDTEVFSLDKRRNLEPGVVRIVQEGPLRAAVEVEQKISDKSSIITTISLDAYFKPQKGSDIPDVSYLDFASEVDWNEDCKFLKVEFPVDVHSDVASYETQFGQLKRPTHYNTSWDVAKFEVCAHKWGDLSDYNYGVTLINDCKYGYSIHGNVMRLSLLRSPKAPDAHADMGHHQFRYALLPHAGPVSPDVVRAAYNFNHRLKAFYIPRAGPSSPKILAEEVLHSFGLVGDKSLILSNIKRFEDDADISRGDLPVRSKSQNVIIRVYDSLGAKSRGKLISKLPVASVHKTNLLEDDLDTVEFVSKDGTVEIPIILRPFEVATFRVELA